MLIPFTGKPPFILGRLLYDKQLIFDNSGKINNAITTLSKTRLLFKNMFNALDASSEDIFCHYHLE